MKYVYKLLKWMTFFTFFWFLLFFEPRWLGWLVAIALAYRMMKAWLNPRKTSALAKLVDCSYYHSDNDSHRHTGKRPDKNKHVHSKVRSDQKDQHARHSGHPHKEGFTTRQ
ncbi:hypothetical protein GOV07_02645 [Candidatus Woesearchaeota archaeon]|nr:hypothetical protein [Candidatus Woesearchaeota archaeon]